ncbi:SAR2788 family putative toxin [Terribacillus sp. JSM ZJ617]|uniref:SAR2788 family putative toxin n=1 Tax=Terribacillus sp. JSM ZJ617 TaxID=3342119 RepID=UPI0035A91963
MKKLIAKLLVFTLLLSALPLNVFAESSTSEEQEQSTTAQVIQKEEVNQIAEELNVDNTDDITLTVHEEETETTVNTEMSSSDLYAAVDVVYNEELDSIVVNTEIEIEPGNLQEKSYDIIVDEASEEALKFTLVDKETGEIHNLDSTEVNASIIPAIPILVGFLARFGISWIVKKFGSKAVKSAVSGLAKQIKKKSASKASTGRQTANNLEEQIAMKSVLSNPLEGAKQVVPASKMNDKRWPGSKGWVKMQRTFKVKGKKTVTIHFNYNKKNGKFDDFKFK